MKRSFGSNILNVDTLALLDVQDPVSSCQITLTAKYIRQLHSWISPQDSDVRERLPVNL